MDALHMKCGKCGEEKDFTVNVFQSKPGYCVHLTCNGCRTIHSLSSIVDQEGSGKVEKIYA